MFPASRRFESQMQHRRSAEHAGMVPVLRWDVLVACPTLAFYFTAKNKTILRPTVDMYTHSRLAKRTL